MKEELQEFNINLEDIEENIYLFNNKKFPHWEFNDDNINDILEILEKENI